MEHEHTGTESGTSGSNTGSNGTESGTPEHRIARSDVFRLWLTQTEACKALGVGERTLRKYVAQGRAQRRRIGRECRYLLSGMAEHRNGKRNTGSNTGSNGTENTIPEHRNTGSAVPALALVPSEAEPVVEPLVQHLVRELERVSRERGEAIAAGLALADQRDTLAAERDGLTAHLEGLRARKAELVRELVALPWYARAERSRIILDLARL